MKKVDLNDYISNKSLLIYIFLDIDGVLNSENYLEKCYRKHHKPMSMNQVPFDPKCLNNLMILVQTIEKHYQVKIILSSTWRLHDIDYEIVDARLAEYGLHLSDKTPIINQERGKEIKSYLECSEQKCNNFLILDDEDFDILEYFPHNIVKTNFRTGFNKKCLKQSLKLLNIKRRILDGR